MYKTHMLTVITKLAVTSGAKLFNSKKRSGDNEGLIVLGPTNHGYCTILASKEVQTMFISLLKAIQPLIKYTECHFLTCHN